jgi:hypothetical protein
LRCNHGDLLSKHCDPFLERRDPQGKIGFHAGKAASGPRAQRERTAAGKLGAGGSAIISRDWPTVFSFPIFDIVVTSGIGSSQGISRV